MKFPSKTSVLAALRREIGKTFDPDWCEEAIAAAAAVPYQEDEAYGHTACAAAMAVLKTHIAAQSARTRALNKKTDAQISMNAAIAACEAMPERGIKH